MGVDTTGRRQRTLKLASSDSAYATWLRGDQHTSLTDPIRPSVTLVFWQGNRSRPAGRLTLCSSAAWEASKTAMLQCPVRHAVRWSSNTSPCCPSDIIHSMVRQVR
eukprot:scpid40961/ scgid35250/ 